MTKKFLLHAVLYIVLLSTDLMAQQWRPVGGSRQANISGMALISHEKQVTTLLVVHDNKKPEQIHATIFKVSSSDSPTYTPLKWGGDDIPVDLEAVTSIPGKPGEFMAFAAIGRVYHFRIDVKSESVVAIKSFDVPVIPKDADFEGFALQRVNDMLLAIWAERGATEKPATIFWSKFDTDTYKFGEVGTASFKVPYPTANVRHVSDIKVDPTGAVFITAASDPGNDGPFSSAAYFAGVLRADGKSPITFLQPASFSPIFRFSFHKVEAFEFVPGVDGGLAFGTDDENLGAALFLNY